jgi:hypothetical protein
MMEVAGTLKMLVNSYLSARCPVSENGNLKETQLMRECSTMPTGHTQQKLLLGGAINMGVEVTARKK